MRFSMITSACVSILHRGKATQDTQIIVWIGEFGTCWAPVVRVRIAKAAKPTVTTNEFIMPCEVCPDAWCNNGFATLNHRVQSTTMRCQQEAFGPVTDARDSPSKSRSNVVWTRDRCTFSSTFISRFGGRQWRVRLAAL